MHIDFAAVPHPDEIARDATLHAHGGRGTLGGLAGWVAACQGQSPPRIGKRPRVVVFGADHGIAAKGVSARPPEATRELFAALVTGGGVIGPLADDAGASVRAVDMAVDTAITWDDGISEFKVGRGSGSIDTGDALTEEQTEAAVRAGTRIADSEVDAGADLLVPVQLGVGGTTPAATLVAALTSTEPVAVIGRGSGIDDAAWMRKATAVRDALRRARPVVTEPLDLLRTAGGADLAALAGFLAQAAVRRTPVLLDGLCVTAAALVAEELAPGARSWWTAAHRTTEPAHALALDHLDLEPVVDLGLAESEGVGALAVLPLLTTAVRLARA